MSTIIPEPETEPLLEPALSPFCAEVAKSSIVLPNNNGSELKHTLDDCVRRILVLDYKFKEIHIHTDRRLLLGYAACAFAAYASAYSYIVPFPDCKPVLLVCVVAYFILNGAMMVYATYIEKDIIFQGVKKDSLGLEPDKKVTVRANYKRFTPNYTVTFEFGDEKDAMAKGMRGRAPSPIKLKKTFGDYYDVEGRLAPSVLVKDVASVVDSYGLKME
ncbi:hypothetical protein SpCBS45565_g01507 [Spizellomyces sp. 'palustris']|nr:hypothetical protein SpCBS45565_g01507 [Spizellomyces sp. 'palustris']